MSDTLMTIIGIFVAVILMFILPLVIMTEKNDEIAQTVVQVAVSDFVETVTNQGRISEFDYSKLVQKISATGNAYDIQIEAQIIDDNPRRATSTLDSSITGDYKYYSVYTNTIMDKLEQNGEFILKKDDYLIVNVKNTNTTLGTQFKNVFYKLTGKDTYTIGTSASGIVVNSNTNVEAVNEITPNEITLGEKTLRVLGSVVTSNNLKIKLNRYDDRYPVTVSVDSISYKVGDTLPSYVIYLDTTSNTYILDLKLIKEILNLTDTTWNSSNIQIEYVRK